MGDPTEPEEELGGQGGARRGRRVGGIPGPHDQRLGVEDKQWVMVRVGGERGIIYDDVLVRVKESYALDMHLDTDEGNACGLKPETFCELKI